MISRKQNSREYWHDVLAAGGFTSIPRWTTNPVPGVAECDATVGEDTVGLLLALAEELAVPEGSILLAAHAKVLAALSGERDVSPGYVAAAGASAVPCRLTTAPDSWQDLLKDIHRCELELVSHAGFPLDELKQELKLTEPLFETIFDPTGGDGELPEHVVLQVSVLERDGNLAIRLRYRTDHMNAECAERICGYHKRALELIAADPEAEHRRQSLLSQDERHFQIEGLAGPKRELPDKRFHELFEARVEKHPDAIAGIHEGRQLTYRELNARANKLGRVLLSRGLRQETVVAVVTERNLDWMTAVLAVFKAGGVYLPIEPHFPSDRIANMFSRAKCEFVLTEKESTATLDGALATLPDIHKLYIAEICDESRADDNLSVNVAPNQAAYIYFTSGSTGEPKGAMCEHAGMINHLYAKIDDLGITEGEVVSEIAPQCFDISLWQLISALLMGGRTLIISQQTIMDVERFVDTIVEGKVGVMQVVPSYLEVVLSYLEESKRDLPDLKCVSVTGEAVTIELVRRWFSVKPGIKLVNAYGLTETSDDTNHEVMDRPPDGERVPLGPAVNNVYVYVVDEHLSPVPLGAPGEIVFSGVCVGRGYVNDPERTRLAFMDDPIRKGERLYRSGDYGCWRPDRKLEFLGRRDAQVKIRGFRIEIGEIENRLSKIPGVRQAAVVVAERADNKQLAGFYSGDRYEVADLQNRLGESLPSYMVPPAIHWQEDLPLTPNGKINKKQLKALATELIDVEVEDGDIEAPATPSEQRLAAAFAKALGVPEDQIGRNDHFFDKGGTSLSAVKLVVALDRAISLTDVTRNPVLADLASLVDGKTQRRSELLQLLSESDGQDALVCLPYAGGNAVSFQPMAMALRGSGLAVYAVELPGHDLASESEPFEPMDAVVKRVADEITKRGITRVFLWGHSVGAAFAFETARQLENSPVNVEHVFVGAQVLGDAERRRAHLEELSKLSNADIAAKLSADRNDPELAKVKKRAEHVGAAFRHDCVSAHEYLVGAIENPPTTKLSTPVTVVVAADDPSTANHTNGHSGWQLLAEQVDLHELENGGHYFLRTRPEQAVQPVLRAAGSMASSEPS